MTLRPARGPRSVSCLRALLLLALVLAARAGDAPRWAQMDYGPAFSCTLLVDKTYVLRALLVRLDPAKQTWVCYDLETMRVAALWSGGFLDGRNVVFNGEHHAQPQPAGSIIFSSPMGPGWAHAGSFTDPREERRAAYNVPAGASDRTREGQPLPAAWLRPRGYYLHGQDVVLSYVADGCAMLERPSLTAAGGLVRTFSLAPSAQELRVDLAAAGTRCILGGDAAGATIAEADGRVIAVLPAATAARTLTAVIGAGDAGPAQPLAALTTGGPARWAETVVTHGSLGKPAADAPYAVDTLTLPDENPWHAWMRPGGFDFFPDGKRAALCTWSGDVWIVSGIDGALQDLTWKRYASGLYQPLGLKIVGKDILCTCRDRIVRLHDLDGDGEADFYESFNSDMELTRHFHEFMLDLQTDPQGNLYFAKASTPGRGGPNFDLWCDANGCYFKLSPDGAKLEVVARGLRAPNGIGVGPHGEMVAGDNQGSWVPVCPINRIREGAFVGIPDGVPGPVKPTKRDPPIIWIPYDIDNSSGGQVWVPDGRWGPFAGSMLHLSYGKCTLFAAMTQTVGDVMQGALTRFPLTFASGIMRARFSPADGQLYVCGLRGWQTSGGRDGCLQRVRYTGAPVRMACAWVATHDGVEITFTSALDKAAAEDVGNYTAEQFNVVWSASYGSPEVSVADPTQKRRDHLEISAAHLKADGRTVVLAIPGMRPVNCQVVTCKIAAADGAAVTATVYGTINALP